MESGIDPGQDYYTQDYYNYDHGYDLPQYGSRRKLISPTGMYDEYGEVIMEEDGSYYYSPHESEGEVVRKGRRLASPRQTPTQAFGDQTPKLEQQLTERTAHPHSSQTESQLKAPIKQLSERKSGPPASHHFPWRKNRIFPKEIGGGIDVSKPTTRKKSISPDSGMVIDGSYFQTKEAMPSAKTRLGKVLSQMNNLRMLPNSLSHVSGTGDGNRSVSRTHIESDRESETMPGDSGKREHEKGRISEDVTPQSYTGSATSFTPHPYRLQEGTQMSALDSDKESRTNTETDDTESKTESGTEQDSEAETDEASEREDGAESSTESQESRSNNSGETAVSVRPSHSKHSSNTSESFNSTTVSSDSESQTSSASSYRSRAERGEDKDHEEDKEMNESVSRIRPTSEEKQDDVIQSTSSLSVTNSRGSDINKLPPIAENEEDTTSDRSDASDDAPSDTEC
ncbi:hypothetical protein E1301_Tti018724 [Triplophysa tibetana]|uniref:Uncharacterized protein n=1 Tax=Triplophysa tibetana TaxID=1572043 RepID=A0A5A9PZA9_9TELE|nr:hypothetical protein E1301_Tti018724 [Triplophysa tibetana]